MTGGEKKKATEAQEHSGPPLTSNLRFYFFTAPGERKTVLLLI